MIQFLGLHLGARAAAATILSRDLDISAEVSTPMVNAVKDPETGIVEVPVAEWVRAGAYATQEAYFRLPVPKRKLWGLGLAGPEGWIALDVAFEPVSPLRLTLGAPIAKDIARWLEANPRMSRKLSVILSPKDYFRFIVSGGIAADVTSASRLGLLRPGKSQWDTALAESQGIHAAWLPPVFDSHVKTGRLSEEGIRRTSLPGGLWLVAGAHEEEAALLAAGDLRDGNLWRVERPGEPSLIALGIPPGADAAPPAGWRIVRSAMEGHRLLEREASGGPEGGEDLAPLRGEIEAAGFPIREVAQGRGSASLGAATLAAIGSGLARGWDHYYKNRSLD